MTDHHPGTTSTRFCWHQGGLLPLLLFLVGCPWAGVPEMLIPYDFQTDPNGDATLANARSLTWRGDTAFGVGGISIDPASFLSVRSFVQSEEIIGRFLPPRGEIDVFSLGQLDAGDEISLTHSSLAEQILLMTPVGQASFAEEGAATVLILVNEDQEIVGYPGAAPVVVQSHGEYFIVVDSGESVAFDYTFTVTRRPNREPAPRRGVLLLNFDGAADLDITFPGGSIETLADVFTVNELPPFDLEQVRPDLPGQTERFKQLVQQFVEYIYADYDVLVTTDSAEAEAAGHHDTVVFTSATGQDLGFESENRGIEPAIDAEDQRQQVGIIFIQASLARTLPDDFNGFCARWANVAAHEYGHAIGLFHVEQQAEGLMAFTCFWAGGCKRELRGLTRAPLLEGSPLLIQDPDAYLARIFGRREPQEAAAIRAQVADLLPE